MRRKTGWIWILGAILLFPINLFTFANKMVFDAAWADMASTIVGMVICPILLLIGVAILILGGKK